MFDRLDDCFGAWWSSFDQLCCVTIRTPFYILFGWGGKPSADQTVSAFVGINAIAGKGWALRAEKLIDAIMGPGHCRGAIARDEQD
jgi:hypothetical protein